MLVSLLNTPFTVGDVTIRNRVLVAPMSGVSDLPFRLRAWQAGAGLVVSEMVASGELVSARKESHLRLSSDGIDQHVVQLAGRDPYLMAEAARIAQNEGADIIDINFGCPAKKVTGGYCGSALMREPDFALQLVEAVISAVDVPVTVKMRLGWDDDSINAPEIAQRCENVGVAMVSVHGRTRMQFYKGNADWQAIKKVRERIKIPLVANGDVTCAEDALKLMEISGADAIMVGRACYGQPWLAGLMVDGFMPDDIAAYAISHYEDMLSYYGVFAGKRHARKHLDWYISRHSAGLYSADERMALVTELEPEKATILLADILGRAHIDRNDNKQRVA
ncbi:tRNA dihydrouridine synthase DusB [Bartonella sp. HY761]|uniref:tRNA dihydrouridine synthase DusB n=1 Tax=Bartonella sp. HY761 TaxID=2979330 RepID=UPI0021FA1FA9|nr:tRNA dihydrouridine synthase DusB [Bartonella sp. HY761]UXN07160.1 tRNA dihydrouridine synthase DusB [Bartonella sp. HY761]